MSRITRGGWRRRVVLSAEQLEDRTVPAGNVTAFVSGGVLHVTGDAEANKIWIAGFGRQDAVITPLDDTTINGAHAAASFGGIAFAYDIQLNGGDDFVYVSTTQGDIGLFVDTGAGDDGVAIDYAGHKGPTVVHTGAGDDTVSAGVDKFGGFSAFDFGGGDNRIDIAATEFGDVVFSGSGGTNVMGLEGVNFHKTPMVFGFQSVFQTLAPVANDDSAVVPASGTVTVNVAANDLAAAGTLDPSSVTLTSNPAHGTAKVNGDGTITYTAADKLHAQADSFTYTIRNSLGAVSNEATVTIGLSAVQAGPVPTITTTATSPTNLASIPFTVTFDEDVTGFDLTDVHVTNGTASGFTKVTDSKFTFNVAPTADGTVTVSLAAGAAKDAAGKNSVAATKSITSDRTAPVPTIKANSSASGTGPIPMTVTFSEAVTGFTAADVTVTGGTVSGFAGSGTTYTFSVTPDGSGNLIQVNVAASVANDVAGNGNAAAAQFTTLPVRTDAGMVATSSPPAANDPNWQAQPDGLKIWDVQTGTGPAVTATSNLGVFYTGWLLNGTVFDQSHTAGAPAVFPLSGLIQGWKEGLPGMQVGGIRRLYIPAALAYGHSGQGSVPPDSDLIFEIKLVSLA